MVDIPYRLGYNAGNLERCTSAYTLSGGLTLVPPSFATLPGIDLTTPSIETRTSWVVASVSLALLGMSFGGPWITAVGLKAIAADMGGARSVPSLATSLAWFGAAARRHPDGTDRRPLRHPLDRDRRLVDDLRRPPDLDARPAVAALLGHGLFMGLLGNAGLNAPLFVYVSRWFDRRRGSALALISSGGYLAGFVWPTDLRARDRDHSAGG